MATSESEARPVPITVALERVGAQAEGADFAGAFPFLDQAQIEKLRRYGAEETVEAGLVLFREGERGSHFVVVLTGSVEAIAHGGRHPGRDGGRPAHPAQPVAR
jgi:CRP-like cAMP-binding protein